MHIESAYPATSREKEIAELFAFVKTGKSTQLIGMPGVGRGNILGFLAYNRAVRIHHVGEKEQATYHFVVVNFAEIKQRSLLDVWKFFFLELTSSLHERRREEEFLLVDRLFKDALSYQDELVLFQALKDAVEMLTLEKDLFIIFLLDRFETYVPTVTSDFFTNLRSLRSRAKYKFTLIFSTTRPLEDLLDQELLADFYEFIADNHVYIALKDTVGLTFRIAHLEKIIGKKLSEKTTKDILQLTAGHAKLTRLAMEVVFGKSIQDKKIDADFLLASKTMQAGLTEIWHYLSPDEQQDILHICRDGTCPVPNEFLQKVHILDKDTITIPLFHMFAMEKMQQPKKELFAYQSETNSITKGDATISDSLTHSEFRLLALLLEKANNVVDRESIVQFVWSDSKTQAGVSEQAVDQLVFRLRKKIEDDPSSPTHVLTIKGRGVKFVQ